MSRDHAFDPACQLLRLVAQPTSRARRARASSAWTLGLPRKRRPTVARRRAVTSFATAPPYLHLEAVGETSGDAYVYNTTINSPIHVAADGSYTADQLVHVNLVSKGKSPNMRITFRLHQVFASDDTLISETSDFSLDCRGG